ncbi:MAG: iolE [Rhodospirillales bacterium]|nr:iolE [Rhodospirillales bacterium]
MRIAADQPLGLAHFTVLELPPIELLRLAARIGYASVGLRLHPAFPGSPCYAIAPGGELMREMRRRIEGDGIRVYDIEFVAIDADFVPARLVPVLETAALLGAKRLSVCGDDPDRARLIANFAALCDLAAGFGMGVDLECMAWRRVASLADAATVVIAADRPNGGVLVDALHLSRTGGTPADVLAMPPGLIRSAQLCDAPAVRPTSTDAIIREARAGRLPPGDGALPLHDLLGALPDGTVLSVEVPMTGDLPPEARARLIFGATRRLLEGYRQAGQ